MSRPRGTSTSSSVGVVLKPFLLLTSLLALCACDAFDEARLSPAHHFTVSREHDASTDTDESIEGTPMLDAAASPDLGGPTDDEGPRIVRDASPIDPQEEEPSKPEIVCDDEDGGVPTDSDEDGVLDCADSCPLDPGKTQPGICGCGALESDEGGGPSCTGLRSALSHRWRFDGSGNMVRDEQGNALGAVQNATLSGEGSLALAGGTSNQHVDLPNGLISGFTNMTVEAWVTWTGTSSCSASSTSATALPASKASRGRRQYLMLSTQVNDRTLGAGFATAGPETAVVVESPGVDGERRAHVAVVIDDANDQCGCTSTASSSRGLVTAPLSSIRDVNNWLGRSQYKGDPASPVSLHELRIYKTALNDEQ